MAYQCGWLLLAAAAGCVLLAGSVRATFPVEIEPKKDNEAVNAKVVELFEEARALMPYGNQELGLPSLEPLHIERISVKLVEASLNLVFEATGIVISNVSKFVVNSVNNQIGTTSTTINFVLTLPVLTVTAEHYSMSGKVMQLLALDGEGTANLNLTDLQIQGSITLMNQEMRVTDLTVVLSAGNVQLSLSGTSSTVNTLISQYGANVFEQKRDTITKVIRESVMPLINRFLETARNVAMAHAFVSEPAAAY